MSILENCPDILTVMEAAKVLRVGRSTMYKLVGNGEIKCVKIGRKLLIPKKCLQSFLELTAEKCYDVADGREPTRYIERSK